MFSRAKIKLSDILWGCLMILDIVRRLFFLFLSQICSRPIQIHSRWIQLSQRQQRSKKPFSYTDDDRRKNTFQRYVFISQGTFQFCLYELPMYHNWCLCQNANTNYNPKKLRPKKRYSRLAGYVFWTTGKKLRLEKKVQSSDRRLK